MAAPRIVIIERSKGDAVEKEKNIASEILCSSIGQNSMIETIK